MWVGMGIRSWHRQSQHTMNNEAVTPMSEERHAPAPSLFLSASWEHSSVGETKEPKAWAQPTENTQHSHSELSAWEGNEQLCWETVNVSDTRRRTPRMCRYLWSMATLEFLPWLPGLSLILLYSQFLTFLVESAVHWENQGPEGNVSKPSSASPNYTTLDQSS